MTQPSNNSDGSCDWILDLGTTNHVTSDVNNLNSFYAYEGTDHLQIGNGTDRPITYIDFSSFLLSNQYLTLHNILHVP